jgi:hypothetical protein
MLEQLSHPFQFGGIGTPKCHASIGNGVDTSTVPAEAKPKENNIKMNEIKILKMFFTSFTPYFLA